MTQMTSNLVIATYRDTNRAREAVETLLCCGVSAADIGVVLADSAEARKLIESGPSKPLEAAALGSAVGGTLFGLAGIVLAGPVGILATGPFVALLGGVSAGAGAGGLLGALVGLGIPEHEAALRTKAVQDGGVLITCRPEDDRDAERLGIILNQFDANNVFLV